MSGTALVTHVHVFAINKRQKVEEGEAASPFASIASTMGWNTFYLVSVCHEWHKCKIDQQKVEAEAASPFASIASTMGWNTFYLVSACIMRALN